MEKVDGSNGLTLVSSTLMNIPDSEWKEDTKISS